MSKYDDPRLSRIQRLESIKERLRVDYSNGAELVQIMPQIFADCYWLLDLVENMERYRVEEYVTSIKTDMRERMVLGDAKF